MAYHFKNGTAIPVGGTFGGDAVCTLDICDVELSMFEYRPSLAANAAFAAIFGILGIVHLYLGFRWKAWGFMGGMLAGCVGEVVGYIGRIMLYNNPFSYIGFMIQIVCLTISPVFYTASIYVCLSKTINFFAPELSRFKPVLFVWIFIPFDIICLILQAAGGALSTTDAGQVGVDLSMAGLILQVIVIFAFVVAFSDYMFRYWRSGHASKFGWRVTTFFAGLSTATVLIFARCAFRVAELKDGYSGELMKHEVPFIVMEGVAIAIAATALCFGHPGLVFSPRSGNYQGTSSDSEKGVVMTSRSDTV